MDVFDVRIHAIRRRRNRRRPFEVRWHVGARGKSRSFITGGWPTATAPSWSAPRGRAWRSTRPPASRLPGPPPGARR
jgi:hypothetical protein